MVRQRIADSTRGATRSSDRRAGCRGRIRSATSGVTVDTLATGCDYSRTSWFVRSQFGLTSRERSPMQVSWFPS